MKAGKFFPSSLLKSDDVDGEVILTIKSIAMEELAFE